MEAIWQKYFKNERLIMIPKKQKAKLEVLQYFYQLFDENQRYSEQDVNMIIKNHADDFVLIRRYLIDYRFLKRDDRGEVY